MGIQGYNPGLIWLGHISEDHIHHCDKHAVLVWVPGIFDHGDDVGPLLGQVDEVTARAVGELNCIDETIRADNIRHVGDGGARGCAKVQHLGPRLDVDLVYTAQDCCCQLGAEGVPGSVFNLVISL